MEDKRSLKNIEDRFIKIILTLFLSPKLSYLTLSNIALEEIYEEEGATTIIHNNNSTSNGVASGTGDENINAFNNELSYFFN